MAQSLWHYNFATSLQHHNSNFVHHRLMWFSAKCSERNALCD